MLDNLPPFLNTIWAGLVTAWVFYGIGSHKKPSPFERIIRATIYTAIVYSLLPSFHWVIISAGNFTPLDPTPVTFVLALLLGFIFAVCANNNIPHRFLPRRLTDKSTHPSYSSHAFDKRKGRFIILSQKDGQRILGYPVSWPVSWPASSEDEFFILTQYVWLNGTNQQDEISARNLCYDDILIASKDVDRIEFTETTISLETTN